MLEIVVLFFCYRTENLVTIFTFFYCQMTAFLSFVSQCIQNVEYICIFSNIVYEKKESCLDCGACCLIFKCCKYETKGGKMLSVRYGGTSFFWVVTCSVMMLIILCMMSAIHIFFKLWNVKHQSSTCSFSLLCDQRTTFLCTIAQNLDPFIMHILCLALKSFPINGQTVLWTNFLYFSRLWEGNASLKQ